MNSFYRFFYHFTRLILSGVFIYASIDKIMNPGAFSQAVFNYQVLPGELVNLIALILPWLELVLGACLLSGRWIMGASGLAAILMAVFMGLIFFNLTRGLDISCGCFSTKPAEGPVDKLTLLRDALFLVLAMCLAGLTYLKKTVDNKHQLHTV